MSLKIHQHRSGFPGVMSAINKGSLTIGYIGGSITDQKTLNRWPEYVTAWFVEKYPDVRLYVENAAIGATGSELAVFRAQSQLIDKKCDIIFIEFAVNDFGEPSEKRMRTREGLIRKLLRHGNTEIIIVYTYIQDMYDDMMSGRIPASIAEFEKLAEYYKIGSVWMGLYALEEVRKGSMKWEEWLPDGLHPESRGSYTYARSVISFLEKELIEAPNHERVISGSSLPAPYDKNCWEDTYNMPFSEVKLEGSWVVKRWYNHSHIDQVLDTAAVGSKLCFSFVGRGLSLGFDFGATSAEYRYRLDGGEWAVSKRDRPNWCGDTGWFRIDSIADDLVNFNHTFELEVVHGNREDCKGTNFRLALIGVIQ